jgi:hypothetical protein
MPLRSCVITALLTTLLSPLTLTAQVNVVTQHNDNARTGQNIAETILTPANVNVQHFGKLFSQAVDGYVYAQPLYLSNVSIPGKGTHNVVYVATEHDSIYAFDADSNTGANASPLWQTSFIDPNNGITTVSSNEVACGDLVPEIGVTGTPTIDATTGTLYVVGKIKDHGVIKQKLHALDVTNGAEKFGGPIVIKAKFPGTGDGSLRGVISFNPLRQAQRNGLLLQNGTLYVGFASHCDIGPYHGWILGYDPQTLQPKGKWLSTPDRGLGGFWGGGGGLAIDANDRLFVVTGNGIFDTNSGGKDYGDSIIKLAQPKQAKYLAKDYFTPYDQQRLYEQDIDLGSGGIMLLPDQNGAHPHLLVQVGKEGTIYVVDRDHMGHFNPNNNNQIVQSLAGAVGGVWGLPAWWNNTVYFGGIFDFVKAFSFDPVKGKLSTHSVSESSNLYGYPGPTPSISANGNSNGILWALQTENYNNGGSNILHAYDATNLATELYNTTQNAQRDDAGGAVKFTVPTIANGKVYVPASNRISVYGLLGQK